MSRKPKQPWIVFTGSRRRFDRLQRELASTADSTLHLLPLLEVEIALSESELLQLRSCIRETQELLVCAFSVNGIETLRRILSKDEQEKLKSASWAVPGRRTSEALREYFGVLPSYLSPDDTGLGLASEILGRKDEWQGKAVLAVSAERGREEFYQKLDEAQISYHRFSVYKSQIRPPDKKELMQIPKHSWILIGSPKIAKAFFQNRSSLKPSWRYACLGNTTRQALQTLGAEPIYQAQEADYASLARTLLQKMQSKGRY